MFKPMFAGRLSWMQRPPGRNDNAVSHSAARSSTASAAAPRSSSCATAQVVLPTWSELADPARDLGARPQAASRPLRPDDPNAQEPVAGALVQRRGA